MRTDSLIRDVTHRAKPLVIRGGLARTFGSLVSFLAMIFLLLGLYLLRDAFAHPLAAQAVGVLTAALSITLSTILFYFLLRPKQRHVERERAVRVRRVE